MDWNKLLLLVCGAVATLSCGARSGIEDWMLPASETVDAGRDSEPVADAAASDPMSSCTGSRKVVSLDIQEVPYKHYLPKTYRLTEENASWKEVRADRELVIDAAHLDAWLGSVRVSVAGTGGKLPVPGTYTVVASSKPPWLEIAAPYLQRRANRGRLVVLEVEPQGPHASGSVADGVRLWFDVELDNEDGRGHLRARGCIHYER